MLVHLGEGYFLEKNCIQCIVPNKQGNIINIWFNDGHLTFPYSLLDSIIFALDK